MQRNGSAKKVLTLPLAGFGLPFPRAIMRLFSILASQIINVSSSNRKYMNAFSCIADHHLWLFKFVPMLRASRPKNMYMPYSNDSSEVRNMEEIKSAKENLVLEKGDLKVLAIILAVSTITHWIFLFFVLGIW